MKYYLAIDIGASSGRHIVGWKEQNELKTDEVFRFPNGVVEKDGHLTWDIEALLDNVKSGIAKAKENYPDIVSLSIDTWGVDYVLMKEDCEVLPAYAYRDSRTEEIIEEVHELLPFSQLYNRTGIQFQPFNTIYQLYADKKAGRLEGVTDYLMMPEYLMYKLCGVKVHDYTNATTSGMVNAFTGEIDLAVTEKLGFPQSLFTQLSLPGTVLGEYENIKVVLCATHDTGSAVEGIPMAGNYPYISSGTWSLLGVKTQKPLTDPKSMESNFSNEGGVGYNRYQKNIMGMWLINCLKEELCPDMSFDEIVKLAIESECLVLLDANDPTLLAPKSMKEAFDALTHNKLQTIGDYFNCAYRSLALCYATTLQEMEEQTGEHYNKIYIVGGGAKNAYLNRLTEKTSKKEVLALPIEATALGNLKIQMEADI